MYAAPLGARLFYPLFVGHGLVLQLTPTPMAVDLFLLTMYSPVSSSYRLFSEIPGWTDVDGSCASCGRYTPRENTERAVAHSLDPHTLHLQGGCLDKLTTPVRRSFKILYADNLNWRFIFFKSRGQERQVTCFSIGKPL